MAGCVCTSLGKQKLLKREKDVLVNMSDLEQTIDYIKIQPKGIFSSRSFLALLLFFTNPFQQDLTKMIII